MFFNFKKKNKEKKPNDVVQLKEAPVVDAKKKLTDDITCIKKQNVEAILSSKKLPIVVVDPIWHTIKEAFGTDSIKQAEKNLTEQLKEQARLTEEFTKLGKAKKKLLDDIMAASTKAQSGDMNALNELTVIQQSVNEISEKLSGIEEGLEDIDKQIEETNHDIVASMVVVGYDYIDDFKGENEKLDKEIDELRNQLLEKTDRKKEVEANLKNLYLYMHSIIGHKNIEVVDTALERQSDKKS